MFGDDALGIADSFRVFYIFYIIWGQDCENNVYNV